MNLELLIKRIKSTKFYSIYKLGFDEHDLLILRDKVILANDVLA